MERKVYFGVQHPGWGLVSGQELLKGAFRGAKVEGGGYMQKQHSQL